jgi:hypothetical protein
MSNLVCLLVDSLLRLRVLLQVLFLILQILHLLYFDSQPRLSHLAPDSLQWEKCLPRRDGRFDCG